MIFEKIELLDEFESLVKDENYSALNYWYPYINPYIEGMELARKASLLSLASAGDTSRRNRIHVLLYGQPGTAKSEVRNWVKDFYGAVGIGPTSSEVGLKGSAAGGDITPGALAMADGGVLVIDEADKFTRTELNALLEAMSEGKYEITKGGKNTTLNAECRVIACANDISKFPPELIDRFDFRIETTVPTRDVEKRITDTIYDGWFEEENKEADAAYKVRKYIEWVNLRKPKISKETMDVVKKIKNMYIDLREREPSVRQKETLLRVAVAIAKLNVRELRPRDYIEAITLVDPELNGGKLRALKMMAEEGANGER
jgi:replicative DNA helicase Mcm